MFNQINIHFYRIILSFKKKIKIIHIFNKIKNKKNK